MKRTVIYVLALILMLLFAAGCNMLPAGSTPEADATDPVPTDETSAEPTPALATDLPATVTGTEPITLYVGPETAPCEELGECLLVKTDPAGDYGVLHEEIADFNYEPGFEYELLVQPGTPGTNGEATPYTLVEVVSQTAVGPEPGGTPESIAILEGPLWALIQYRNEAGELVATLPNTEVTAQFVAGMVNGSAGCNGYGGEYTQDGSALTIGSLASTLIACSEPEGIMEQETAFMGLMESVAAMEVTAAGDLHLLDESGQTLLVFTASDARAGLEGPLWRLVEYRNAAGEMTPVLPDSEVTAQFVAGNVNGSGGCNSYGGQYAYREPEISMDALVTTEMFCMEPEGVMDQETAFYEAMNAAATVELTAEGQLRLLDESGETLLLFERDDEPAGEATALIGTTWLLTTFIEGDTASSVIAGSEITLTLGDDGQLFGSAGCNQYNAPYTADAQNLVLTGPPNATRIACSDPPGVLEQETRYLSWLDDVARYEVEGDRLTLFDAAGLPILVYTAQ